MTLMHFPHYKSVFLFFLFPPPPFFLMPYGFSRKECKNQCVCSVVCCAAYSGMISYIELDCAAIHILMYLKKKSVRVIFFKVIEGNILY